MDAQNVNTYEGEAPEDAEHVAEMLDKAEALENPSASDRPEWLPEKFKSPEDMAKAYSELEKKLGTKPTQQEAPEDSEEAEEYSEDVIEESNGEAIDFDAFSQEYYENGGLSEDSYEALEASGIPRALVDQYIAGVEALNAQAENSAYELVGGRDEYQSMTQWAAANLPESKIDAFNRAVNSGDTNLVQMAVQGLNAQYRSEVGRDPSLIKGETSGNSGGVFQSVAQLTAAMKDPRYTNDPAYREEVGRKLARSNIL